VALPIAYFDVQVYPSHYWPYGDPIFSQPTSVTNCSSTGKKGKSDGGSWALWEKIAARRPEFDHPANFSAHIEKSKWVDYSICSAQTAVYSLLGLSLTPPPVYKGRYDPRVLLNAFPTLHDIHARA
jgi:myosin-crossreactive antigen